MKCVSHMKQVICLGITMCLVAGSTNSYAQNTATKPCPGGIVRVDPLRGAILIDSSAALGMTESYSTADDTSEVTLSSRVYRGICWTSIRASGLPMEAPFWGKLKPWPLGTVVHYTSNGDVSQMPITLYDVVGNALWQYHGQGNLQQNEGQPK
jgi:hypothetical protein